MLAVVSLVVGIVIGGSLVTHSVRNEATGLIGVQAFTAVCALESLRAGDTNDAINILEGDLDVSLMTLGANTSGIPPSLRQSLVMPVQHARNYRAKYPSTHLGAGSSEQIGQAFTFFDEKSGH